MKGEKILFLLLTLISTLFFSFIFTLMMRLHMFDKNSLGFQYLFFSLLISFVYFCWRYLRTIDATISATLLAVIYATLLNRTTLAFRFGGILGLFFYCLLLFLLISFIFRFSWFQVKKIRNIVFSLLASLGYLTVHIIASLLLKIELSTDLLKNYFVNGLMMMIVISFGVSIAELAFVGIIKFFQPPHLTNSE
jgi:hypothetical protein